MPVVLATGLGGAMPDLAMDVVVDECGAVRSCLISCLAGLDVVLAAAIVAAGATLPTVLAAEVACGAALTTAGGGGMELESEDGDTSAFTAVDGISTRASPNGAIVVML